MTEKSSDLRYGSLLRAGERLLAQAGIEEARTDAWLLLSFAADLSRSSYYMKEREEAPEAVREKYQSCLEKRAAHIPLQHITGTQDFYGYTFRVTKDVLIPRQDTEILAEQALLILSAFPEGDRPAVLDLCTGSGILAVTIAKEKPGCVVAASDISAAALAVAAENADRLQADVTFTQSDLFEKITGVFDCIVSNPPYIPAGEIDTLAQEVRCHDPLLALDGGADGLRVYRALIPASLAHLKRGGHLLLEIGADQAQAVGDLLLQNGFEDVRVIKDLAGLDRVVTAVKGSGAGR